jgi:hypothetical protein
MGDFAAMLGAVIDHMIEYRPKGMAEPLAVRILIVDIARQVIFIAAGFARGS